jgi:hypothetical protein
MFASSFHPSMRCIPDLPGKSVDWIPVNIAAASIFDLLLAANSGVQRGSSYDVHNITNPRPIPWSSLVAMLQNTFATLHHTSTTSPDAEVDTDANTGVGANQPFLAVVTMEEWVRRLNVLADSGTTPDQLPALKLLQFFENMTEDKEPSKLFETKKSQGVSEALRDCPAFCQDWIDGNVRRWRESGFISG